MDSREQAQIPHPPHKTVLDPLPPPKTIAAYMAENPGTSVAKAMAHLFPKSQPFSRFMARFPGKHSVIKGLSEKELAFLESQGPEIRRRAGWKLPGEEGDGVEVSELFWKIYLSCLPTIERDPLAGYTSPDLLGSTTTMPLSIISLIPDIMKHYRDVIVRAQHEVFLATNYWQPSDSVNTVSEALRELSARVMKEGRPKVVVKVMYDRGSWEQLWNAHAPVSTAVWTKLDLPDAKDVPGLHLEVINFHKVLLGTFHVKFLIVDRKVVLINSCNIQDRPNLEMMTHLEGPVVDSFYDVALHCWHNKLEPPLPCISKPYDPPRDADGNVRYLFRDYNPYFRDIEVLKAARAARKLLRMQTEQIDEENRELDSHPTRDRLVESFRQAMAGPRQSFAHNKEELAKSFAHGRAEVAQRGATAMKEMRAYGERMGMNFSSRPGSRRTSMTDPDIRRQYHDEETAAITAANKLITKPAPSEAPTSPTLNEVPIRSNTYPLPGPHAHFHHDHDDDDPSTTVNSSRRQSFHSANEALSHDAHGPPMTADYTEAILTDRMVDSPTVAMKDLEERPVMEKRGQEILSPVPNGPVTSKSAHPSGPSAPFPPSSPFDDEAAPSTDDSGAMPHATRRRSFQMSMDEEVPPGRGTKRMFKLSKRFNAGALSEAWATVEDSDDLDSFRAHRIHAPHDPFPVAMVCRRPHGVPGHHDISNPQNAAWLAGCRYAKRKVFIQTPTFNARPLVRAVKHACRRGVEVVLFLDLGFNDMAESIMFQGGTNEQVVDRLYKKLKKEGKSQFLKVYWYTSKDQIRPLNAIIKQRNCHIKFAAYDDEVMIMGNANGDTQSVFHSGEVNIMIDNKQVVAEVMDTLIANQNTMKYGGVQADGVWRDSENKTLADYGATGGGGFIQGFKAFVRFAKTAAK
ncbi:hypothetical protein CC85DRAFT_306614 [Cutaneotrichosporon oleaginosum]|uniref:PLD phosphodiesterase domain-containing protein n=1 Tax=Cutaneotrichosporon oleaginosum TaxID=879819 RepID=A0A0J0XWF8_9TREE|nr:uncharacterized protein CC85DRAFT_306614 [Cutaneotrichosporon oleaginosum]KLT45387.1 hypothetical protein CC85DRAFT_306614 [Cutaneotrichosporon oleaginosum]TXT14648.1 hypothetical protein COLE_00841 [Cutaneotrichosporon oleaginosum]